MSDNDDMAMARLIFGDDFGPADWWPTSEEVGEIMQELFPREVGSPDEEGRK